MHFFFLKPDLRRQDTNYSGGQHGFSCAAQALAEAGHSVHLLYCSTKSELMFSLLQQGAMGGLSYSAAVEGVAVWSAQGIIHHVSLSDAEASTAHQLSNAVAALCGPSPQAPTTLANAPQQRLLDECSSLIRQTQHNSTPMHDGTQQHNSQQQQDDSSSRPSDRCWVVLDADSSQAASPPGGSSSSSLLEACCAAFPPRMLLLLVQNIHFLPLGPQGTAARTPALLAAWSQLGGVLCVSSFVARYVAQHAVPLGLPPQRIYCVHFAAFGCFGRGPFPDYGTAAAQHLPWPHAAAASSSVTTPSADAQHSAAQPPATPIIGCLKLTPEKGAAVFLGLARALPQLHFLAVCADPSLTVAAAALPNVRTVPPGDVDSFLQHMTVLLAPSLWQEAYGMVVTDAVLRGVPVLVSDQGGLAEAACGCPAAVVHVKPMQLPATAPDASGFRPAWQDRVFPQDQELTGWVQALQRLLVHRGVYEGCSRDGREAALRLVQHQRQLLDQLVAWLLQLG